MSSGTNEKWVKFKRCESAENDKKGPPMREVNELVGNAEVSVLSAIAVIDKIMSLNIADDGCILNLTKIHLNKAKELLNGIFVIETTGKSLIIEKESL